MILGVPKEIKIAENRVALTPSGTETLRRQGHTVIVETGAGVGSGFSDEQYKSAGATIVSTHQKVFEDAQVILKVKEPLESEMSLFHEGHILFTYLHLAANLSLTRQLLTAKVTAFAYETLQKGNRLPLLVPMSEIAGRLSVQAGARCLESQNGGKGVLLGSVVGTTPARVTILGAGVSGTQACQVALGMGARVTVLDIDRSKLERIQAVTQNRVVTLLSNKEILCETLKKTDLLISTVLIPGDATPKLITMDVLKTMEPGSVFVDVAIDQGGTSVTSRPTTHIDPTYSVYDVVHYCVANMPGAVPRTSTYALTSVTLPYISQLVDIVKQPDWFESKTFTQSDLFSALEVYNGAVFNEHVKELLN